MVIDLNSDGVTAGNRAQVSGDLVMGLRWDRHESDAGQLARHADLDAFCVLLDDHERPIEVVHPGHTHNLNGSVLHTGDSITGSGPWDDERIFIFLDALPEEVSTLAFVVRSTAGQVFRDVQGASCHLSDATTECVYLQANLQPYGFSLARCIAILRRRPDGWHIVDRVEAGAIAVAAESLVLDTEDKG